jgi:hypothetical protein
LHRRDRTNYPANQERKQRREVTQHNANLRVGLLGLVGVYRASLLLIRIQRAAGLRLFRIEKTEFLRSFVVF